MRELLGLSEVRLLPAPNPRLRDAPAVSAELRLEMLQAAIANRPGLLVDDRELSHPGPTTTVETLASLRAEFPGRPLCLILGMDAFARLPAWIRWRELTDLAHIAVATRPGIQLRVDNELASWLAAHRSEHAVGLHNTAAGLVYVQDIPGLDIPRHALGASRRASQSRISGPRPGARHH